MSRENAKPFTKLAERLYFETLLAGLSSKFAKRPAGQVDREIIDAQRCIGEFYALDLLVLWQLSEGFPTSR